MTRLTAMVPRLCGSLALALLLVALAAAGNALADDPPPPCACEPGETQEECDARCAQGPCPNKYDSNGKFLGCLNPGKLCYVGQTPSSCGLSMNKSNCTCP